MTAPAGGFCPAGVSGGSGVSLFSLSRRMGTSLDMIDRTYGHLAPDAEAVELALLKAYDTEKETFGHGVGTAKDCRVAKPHNHTT